MYISACAFLDTLLSLIMMQEKQLMNHLCLHVCKLRIIFLSRYISKHVAVHCIDIKIVLFF